LPQCVVFLERLQVAESRLLDLDLELRTLLEDSPQPQTGSEALPDGTGSRLELHPQFHSRFLADDRDVIVYLPPGYDQTERRYPVLYMHDGQNLFDPETSFIRGRTWQVREHADRLILDESIEPLIVVGMYNTPHRLEEYTHARDRRMGGGEAKQYGQLLVEELKPWIDEQYRTLADEDHTAMGGSSLGGLVTLYLGLLHAETFGKLAVMSPSIWWNHKSILGFVNEFEGPPWPRIWLDVGDGEGKRTHQDVSLLYDRLVTNGWKPEVNVHYQMVEGGTHDESAWAARVGDMLRFLFPAKK
jgi:predicted alpha/beta superfamily hydrolase